MELKDLSTSGSLSARQLIALLDSVLARTPADDAELSTRINLVASTTEALALIGLDAENLIRYGMPHRAGLPVFMAVLGANDADDLPELDAWREVLRMPTRTSGDTVITEEELNSIAQTVSRLPHRITAWVHNAPLSEVISLRPPSAARFDEFLLATPVADETISPYFWLLERSTVDSLDRWRTDSLHLEHRWRNGKRIALFPEAALGDGPAEDLLNREIARRAVEPRDALVEESDRLFWQLQEQAVDFLMKQKFTEAATLFEFHHRLYPDDVRSINNLGFCQLPMDPASALNYLERAEAGGYSPRVINIYNQCCCLCALNRSPEALDKAEAYWQRQREEEPADGFVWAPTDRGWVLKADLDPERALVALAGEIAVELGLADRAARWAERAQLPPIPGATQAAKAS